MKITWPVVAIIIATLAGIVTLGALGRDLSEMIAFGQLVITALVLGRVEAVAQQTNGTTGRLIGIAERAAATTPADSGSVPPTSPVVDTTDGLGSPVNEPRQPRP